MKAIADTGPLVALLNRRDGHHEWAMEAFDRAEKPLLTCEAVLAEAAFQTGLPDVAMDALKDIQLVKAARDAAKEIISNDPEFKKYPLLAKKFEEFQKEVHLE